MGDSVQELQRAINGLAIMSDALEQMHASLLANKVRLWRWVALCVRRLPPPCSLLTLTSVASST
jgi:hypothetical protein